MVNLQLVVLFPVHAPDHTVLRPADSVIDVPTLNDDDPLLPVATLIPAGLEVIRAPERPLAFTVRVAVCGGGAAAVTVSSAVLVAPLRVAEMVTDVSVATLLVVMLKTPLCEPAAMVTLAGTEATAGLLLESATVAAASAAEERITAPCAVVPPETLDGLSARLVMLGPALGVTVSVAVRVAPL